MTGPRRYPEHEPFFLQWHITDRCNLSCAHCYRGTPEKADPSWADLQGILRSFSAFLSQIKRNGRLQISGGEPFLSPHLFDLLMEAEKIHLPTRILTNGTLIDERAAAATLKAGCRLVQVSLEGGQATNDHIRGAGSFDRALAGIRHLKQAGHEVTINMTIAQENKSEIRQVAELAAEHADRFNISRFVPIDGNKSMNRSSILDPADLRSCFSVLNGLRHLLQQIEIPLRDPLWHVFLHAPVPPAGNCVHGCAVGYNGLALDADGTIYPCRRLPISLGNILELDLAGLWRDSPILNTLRDRDRLKGRCGRCKRRWLCGGCRGVAFAVTGDYLDEDPQCFRYDTIAEKLFPGRL